MKILVLGGGNSPEREVSLRSAKSVASAARDAGYEVTEADPADGYSFLDYISKDSIVFPILHGAGGEDGSAQKELEIRGFKYLGTDSESSRNCFNKWKTREVLTQNNIPMPKGFLVKKDDYETHEMYKKPHVLKTPEGGSSIGTYIVRDTSNIDTSKVDEVFAYDAEAVIEELIEGKEITVPILGSSALPVIEIQPPSDGEFDYENKYNGKTRELCPPETVSAEDQDKASRLAEKVHQTMNARHFSRVDIMINKSGDMYVLEINTIPGMTDQSLFPKAAAVYGMSMKDLIIRFVELIKSS